MRRGRSRSGTGIRARCTCGGRGGRWRRAARCCSGLLWPDPCDPLCPVEFKAKARELLPQLQGKVGPTDEDLRKALLKFIADFANWDNAAERIYLEVSRALVKAAHGRGAAAGRGPVRGGRLDPARGAAARVRGLRERPEPRRLPDPQGDARGHPAPRAEARRGAAPRRGGDQAAGGEGAGRPLSEGPGRRDADRLPLGADRALRVAELRRGDPARALVLALQEGEPQAGAPAPGRAARRASRRASSSRSSSRRRRRTCPAAR